MCHLVCGSLIETDERDLALQMLTWIIIMFGLYLTFKVKSVFFLQFSEDTVILFDLLYRCESVL